MRLENILKALRCKIAVFLTVIIGSFASFGQNSKPVPLNLVADFERELIEDLNYHIKGIKNIIIQDISGPVKNDAYDPNYIHIVNAIKSACFKSDHSLIISSQGLSTEPDIFLRAEILPSKGSDFVIFINTIDKNSHVIFTDTYSLKKRNQPEPLPHLLLSLSVSYQPKLQYLQLINQGADTLSQNFSGITYGFVLCGSQYARGRRDLTFGYSIGAYYIVPSNLSTITIDPIFAAMTGVTSELIIKEFNLFKTKSNLSWQSALLTDFTQLNMGRYNYSSGFGLYVSKSFSLRAGIELCNRTVLMQGKTPLGLSKFDRLFIGVGLGL